MNNTFFKIRAYGWRELALLYTPDISPVNASKRLSQWVRINKPLHQELLDCGWYKGCKFLTPLQVKTIVRYLGEP